MGRREGYAVSRKIVPESVCDDVIVGAKQARLVRTPTALSHGCPLRTFKSLSLDDPGAMEVLSCAVECLRSVYSALVGREGQIVELGVLTSLPGAKCQGTHQDVD